jgi:hypothetical protein
VPFRNDRLTDLVDRLRLQLTNVVTNRAPLEFGVCVPRTDVHNGSQLDVIFRQVLQLIVRVIASVAPRRLSQENPFCCCSKQQYDLRADLRGALFVLPQLLAYSIRFRVWHSLRLRQLSPFTSTDQRSLRLAMPMIARSAEQIQNRVTILIS